MNVNELIAQIKEIALNQFAASAYDGDVYVNWNSSEVKYGSVNVGIQNISYDENMCTYTLVLYYADRLLQDNNNQNDVYTDGIRVLQGILNVLNQEPYVDISFPVIYTPFNQKFADYLGGVYTTVDITCDSEIGLCSLDNYEWHDDKDEIIRQLEAKIREYELEDEALTILLKQIRYKLNGTPIEED